jgi:hypothetical protein
MFQFHQECKNISAFTTSKTMKNLLGGYNVKAGRFLFVKRTEGFIIIAGRNQAYMFPDNLDDIGSFPDLCYYFA